jgi:hypothetical protein
MLTLAADVSALVCLGFCMLWLRSYRTGDGFTGYTHAAMYSGEIGRGRVWVARDTRGGSPQPSFAHTDICPPHPIAAPVGMLGRLGFFLDRRPGRRGEPRWSLVFPIWLMVAVTAVLPAWVMPGRIRRRRRRARGACLSCGYDLRATPERCPECGVVPAQRVT